MLEMDMRRPVELKGGSAGGLLMNCLFLKDLETGVSSIGGAAPFPACRSRASCRAHPMHPRVTAGSCRSATGWKSIAATC
jgi:carotenoid cleavage dioxygenase